MGFISVGCVPDEDCRAFVGLARTCGKDDLPSLPTMVWNPQVIERRRRVVRGEDMAVVDSGEPLNLEDTGRRRHERRVLGEAEE